MAHLIIWSNRAVEDLEAIAEYIAQDSEAYASSVVRTILQKCRVLAEFPMIGRVVPEFDDETMREIFAFAYRIIYEVDAEQITIAAVIHGKRLLELAIEP